MGLKEIVQEAVVEFKLKRFYHNTPFPSKALDACDDSGGTQHLLDQLNRITMRDLMGIISHEEATADALEILRQATPELKAALARYQITHK